MLMIHSSAKLAVQLGESANLFLEKKAIINVFRQDAVYSQLTKIYVSRINNIELKGVQHGVTMSNLAMKSLWIDCSLPEDVMSQMGKKKIRLQNADLLFFPSKLTLSKSCHQLKTTSCSQVNSSPFQLITVQKRASTGCICSFSYMTYFHWPPS